MEIADDVSADHNQGFCRKPMASLMRISACCVFCVAGSLETSSACSGRAVRPVAGGRQARCPGNHDYYSDHRHPDKLAEKLHIVWLDNAAAFMGGVRFLGCTLWTDFMCRPAYVDFADAQRGALKMNDYRCIKVGRGRGHDRLKPRDTINDHKASVKWLETQLSIPFAGETVVVSHHAPSPKSLVAGKPYLDLDWCYASNCEHLMTGDNAPQLWVHGHIHRNQDYVVGGTRVVCNPRGY
jgi:hypothetical protein